MFVVMTGLPGSGKSTLAREVEPGERCDFSGEGVGERGSGFGFVLAIAGYGRGFRDADGMATGVGG